MRERPLSISATPKPARADASTYGLTENERGEVHLTELGRRIVDPEQEATAG